MSIKVAEILAEVAAYYNVTRTDILSVRRTQKIVVPRQMVMYLAREMTTLSFPQIGAALGNRDHTTCLHGWRIVATRLATDKVLARDVDLIRNHIMNGRTSGQTKVQTSPISLPEIAKRYLRDDGADYLSMGDIRALAAAFIKMHEGVEAGTLVVADNTLIAQQRLVRAVGAYRSARAEVVQSNGSPRERGARIAENQTFTAMSMAYEECFAPRPVLSIAAE